jgi:acylphosphatase
VSVLTSKRLVIRGQVQGVGYRYAMVEKAGALGVHGWVRNRRDGTVEAHVHGDAHAVEALVAWSRRGPPAARVQGVDVEEVPEEIGLAGFGLRPTA